MKRDVERFFKQLMVVLLMLRADCSLLALKPAHFSPYLPPELPIPHKEMVELAQTLAQGYDFAAIWPYTREQMEIAMSPGHPDLRPDIPDEHILFVARQVEKRLLVQLATEGVVWQDATQAGMLVVAMTHTMLFDESSVFGADQLEMYHVARILVASHSFHPDWPYRDQVKAALVQVFNLPRE